MDEGHFQKGNEMEYHVKLGPHVPSLKIIKIKDMVLIPYIDK